MNFLAIANVPTSTYFIIGAILAVQWVLAIFSLMRLFADKVKAPACIFWNIFIVTGVFVGPISYLIVSKFINKKNL